jgi:transposase
MVVMARRANLNIALHVPDEYKLSRYQDKCDHAVVHARREPRDRECPRCGASGHVNGRSERKVYHMPVKGCPLVVFLEVVRFRCPECGRTWYDGHEGLVSDVSPHITNDLAVAILVDIVGKMSMAAIARKEGPSVSVCNKVLDAAIMRTAYLPRTLCIDEFKADTDAGKMSVGVADGEGGNLVEILRRPRGDCLDEFFGRFGERQRNGVEYYCCDSAT